MKADFKKNPTRNVKDSQFIDYLVKFFVTVHTVQRITKSEGEDFGGSR